MSRDEYALYVLHPDAMIFPPLVAMHPCRNKSPDCFAILRHLAYILSFLLDKTEHDEESITLIALIEFFGLFGPFGLLGLDDFCKVPPIITCCMYDYYFIILSPFIHFIFLQFNFIMGL